MLQYPTKTIKFVVGSPAGGGVDMVTRIVAAGLKKSLGQPVVVENITGTSAMIGSEKAAKSVADGYTLLMVSSQFSVLPAMYSNMPYDTLNDFVPLAQVATAPLVLVVPPALPVNSIVDLITLAKTRKLKYANAGNGGSPHLAAESFKVAAEIDLEGVLYEGGVPSIKDLMLGKVDLFFASLPSVMPHLNEQRLKGLGVTTAQRAHGLPATPTIAEAGLAGYEYSAWFGALAPAKTPTEIASKLGYEIPSILRLPETREQLRQVGYEPAASSPDQFANYLRAEMKRWAEVVANAGIRPI